MHLYYAYRKPALSGTRKNNLLTLARQTVSPGIEDIETEFCFYIETREVLSSEDREILRWLLSETFEPENFSYESFLTPTPNPQSPGFILEVGPRMNFTTSWSTNAVSICHACGLTKITRIERSRRYKIISLQPSAFTDSRRLSGLQPSAAFLKLIHDRMTECQYIDRLETFETGLEQEQVYEIRVIETGRQAIEEANKTLGLGLDEWDIDYYYNLFAKDLKRNPTNVECFDLGQSNSEHSRHWFFKGRLIVDGIEVPQDLMDIIKEPYKRNPNNSIIAFGDNSSAIRGYALKALAPDKPGALSRLTEKNVTCHIIFTAETHNFPSGVAPFPGAETGTGGRIRDVQAVGRGGLVIAGTAAYCVGNLYVPGYKLPWEDAAFEYPKNLASPLQIEIEASNGASDYGNKFGEPLIQGFTRSFGLRLPNGERREWIKPIMFTGGVGQMDERHVKKAEPEKGMLVVKVGGPAYRIGMGGGAASSMIQGENIEELDFNAVQRGDAEMEQKLNRAIRACVELGENNPIVSIHDQGAGGNCNVIKEIIYPAGAKIDIKNIPAGDSTLSVLELWGAEFQESNALLIKPASEDMFGEICRREKVPFAIVGRITGDGYIVLYDEKDGSTPVNLDLKKVLGDMPQKTFNLSRVSPKLELLSLPVGLTVRDALERVLRLVSVGSKRFLTNKADRSVTGLVARQQCAGPLQLTVADAAVISQGYLGLTGAAISIGEQPIKGLIDPACMARMSVAEALTNMVWAKISRLEDIRCSGNWMWPAKLPGEGAALYDAAVAMRDIMLELGIAIDGGKDSLSMAAVVSECGKRNAECGIDKEAAEIVKAPGSLVISAYATCPDITKVLTPDIKRPGQSRILYIDMGKGKYRLGGSALAHVYGQVGNESPDIEDPHLLKRAFLATQQLIERGLILSGHDISDGGMIIALLEMAFAGNCGVVVNIRRQMTNGKRQEALSVLFAEEAGLLMEYLPLNEDAITSLLKTHDLPYQLIGDTITGKKINISYDSETVLNEDMKVLRALWEETSYQLDRLQANPECVDEEKKNIFDRKGSEFKLTFTPEFTPLYIINKAVKPKVAIIREEGSNGDREMSAAFYLAGFEPWDIAMSDLLKGKVLLDEFRGLAFVGGFSYADVLDSAKGWAGVIKFHQSLYDQFDRFYERLDTFSLGICNGCQLMALLGWVPWRGIADALQPRFIHNKSGRFESRFTTLKIEKSRSIMLKGVEGSVLGVWVSHGEGMAYFPDKGIHKKVLEDGLAPARYADDNGAITEAYPFNPNGSPDGIAALCSPDGRHLAIMPHPERTFLKWQWPWMPEDWKHTLKASPWLRMFQNAREWCGE